MAKINARKKRKERYKASEIIGSARMVTLTGQPFLDSLGELKYAGAEDKPEKENGKEE